jgi:glycosyltransferase involved in cell wall biosynthesis
MTLCADAPLPTNPDSRAQLRPKRRARRVRVLFLNDTARNGGPGRSLYHLLRFLDPEVIDRGVALPRPGPISELLAGKQTQKRVVDELYFARHMVENPIEPWGRAMVREDFDAPWPLRGARFAGNVARGSLAVLELARLVHRGRFDLLYCNGTNANFWGGAVAWMTRVPAIWHVRYTAVPAIARGAHEWLAASPGVARILCVSEASAEQFRHVQHKQRVVPNALDIEEYRTTAIVPRLRKELGLGSDTLVFGSHGRILRRKGYVEMIGASRHLMDRMNRDEQRRTAFVVLGDTPEDFRDDHLAECRALVRGLGLEAHFFLLGFRADVRPYVVDYDVAVVPSVYEDPLPRAVLESMALGKPVIAFDVGGVAEMVEDGATGSLVRGRPPDVGALADAMHRYARDPDLRRRHGQAGLARVARDFDGRKRTRAIADEIVRAAGVAR